MKAGHPVKALFLDIGGVLLTNGWDRYSREKAANRFALDFAAMNERHRIIFDAYESGKMSLDDYLKLLVFYEPRTFTPGEFKTFMMGESEPFPEMIELMAGLKQQYRLTTVAVNNEGRELNEYRIRNYNLKTVIDIFASSCFINARKPDKAMYTTALDIAQVQPQETIYIDDRLVFIEVAAQLGINTIHHTAIESTRQQLGSFGLELQSSQFTEQHNLND